MNSLGDYPIGAANDPRAPYNEIENPAVEIDVKVNITLSKTVKVKVQDYDIEEGTDEDGYYCDRDFSATNLIAAVEEQIILPQDASLYIDVGENLKAANDLSGWTVKEFECTKD